jgi:hypothetical protein
MVYENQLNNKIKTEPNSIAVKFSGTEMNKNGIGVIIKTYQKEVVQTYTNNPYRGYISSQPTVMNIGLGNTPAIDSLVVIWPDKLKQTISKIAPGELMTIDIKNAKHSNEEELPVIASNTWFTNITSQGGINYFHQQRDFVDFNIQKLLPHKLSEYTPGIAAGDINGDGLEDFITGGVSGNSPMIFLQNIDGSFTNKPILDDATALQKQSEDRGLLLFDADNDKDLDLYISAGGYQYDSGTKSYTDILYLNNGKGMFTADTAALPLNYTSKFCVRAADYDKDGDLDIFIAGRVDPHAYPRPVSSFIYRNDSKNGGVHFTNVTKEVAPSLLNIGLTCDAIFSDYDNDGWIDIVLTGEWMPVTFLHNEKGIFVNAQINSGINNYTGWWNSLAPGDFDNDGDIDYIAGNLGLNSFFRASEKKPVNIYANDFDGNGSYDAILSLFLLNNLQKNAEWFEFPAHGRDDMIKQILNIRRDFQNYKSYALATMDNILPDAKRKDAIKLSANYMASAFIQNDGNGHFSLKALPTMAQLSIINGMVVDDFNGDGNLDVAFNTNDYGTDPFIGRYDALNGLVLKGDGKGSFTPLSILESGIFINGNGKGLATLAGADSSYLLVATQNRGNIQLYRKRQVGKYLKLNSDDSYALINFTDGRKQRIECNYGASFLSQSSRLLWINNNVKSINITNNIGVSRKINLLF